MQQITQARQWLAALLMFSALLLLLAVQSNLQQQQLTLWGSLALLFGLGLWLGSLHINRQDQVDRPGQLLPPVPGPRLVLLVSALLCAGLAFYNSGGNVFRATGVIPWLLAVGLWLAAWWRGAATGAASEAPSAQQAPAPRRTGRWRAAIIVALLAIMAVGAFFRLHQLAAIPGNPTSDHAEKNLDVQDLIDGRRPIFFPRNTGREPAQFYITYGLIKLFDLRPSFLTLKLGTSLIDLLTVPAIFLLASELAGAGAGLVAALLYAISKWALAIARMGLRFPYAPLPTTLALWLLLRYMRRGDRRDALLCGVVIGLGLYGYSPFRIVVLAVPTLLLLVLLFDPRRRGQRMRVVADGLLVATTAMLVFLPLGRFMLERPDLFWYRAATRAGNAERQIGETLLDAFINQLPIFLSNNLNAFLAFHWRGDSTIVNAVRYDPFLDPITAAALLAGTATVVYRIIAGRSLRYLGLVLVLPILMLASTLSIAFPIENPSVNRMGPAAPVVFTITALPLVQLAQQLIAGQRRLGPIIAGVTLAGLLASSARHNYIRYFHHYPMQYNNIVVDTNAIVRAIERAAAQGIDLDHTYILAYPYWIDTRNVGIELGRVRWVDKHTILPDEPLPQQAEGKPLLLVINSEDIDRLREVQTRWPKGELTRTQANADKSFYLFLVPSTTPAR